MFIKIISLIILFKLTQQLMEEQNHLDLNDILNENYMPSTFLFLDGSSLVNVSTENINKNIGNYSNVDGSITKALSTMGYHRDMMEKYLCNNFVAERVLTEFSSETFQRRLGLATGEFVNTNHKLPIKNNNNNIQNAMRFDQGSTAYQNWLSKTTTLDDIHNNMALTQNAIIDDAVTSEMDKKEQHSKIDRTQYPRKIPIKRNDQQVIYNNNNNDGDDYVEGDITGYAIEQPMKENNYQPDIQQHYGNARNQQNNFFQHIAGSKIGQQYSTYYNNLDNDGQNLLYTSNVDGVLNTGGFTPGHTTTTANIGTTTNFNPLLQHFISKKKNLLNNNPIRKFTDHIKTTLFGQKPGGDQYKYGEGYSDSGYDDYGVQHTTSDKSSKEMSLKDLFDIALTTLAFLSFGMFILQVIMCVTMTKNDNSMMMMPMEVEEIDMTEEIRRRKRSIHTTNLTQLHELTIHILRSIDSAVYAKYDNGKCLQYTICVNNKFSRKRKDNQKFWVPIWGLGMSWLSGRVIPKQERSVSIFNGLKASIMGLGNRDCKELYQCNLRELVNKYKDVYEP